MQDSPTPQAPPPRKLGFGFIVAGWVLALGLLAGLSWDWLDQRQNPNRAIRGDVSAGGVREVRLRRNVMRHYVATGRINGHEVVFLLDTGATRVAIPGRVAARVGLKPGRAVRAETANGIVTMRETRLASVELGPIRLGPVVADINPHMAGDEVLLGMSFLKHLELSQRGDSMTLRQHPES